MKIDVYDSYALISDGTQFHFDVLVPEGVIGKAQQYATEWLKEIGICDADITLEQCSFCHSESVTPEIEQQLVLNGYFILQMEGCPSPIF
ncbi:MAG: DUF2024 family protein [Candidatus Thiodiazotropha sp. (ex Codakia rugifera)]|nr:DUF2024 family protein [Candidatus Thiodiazotropha sp. (ex Codakia rugifera)]